MQVLAPYKLLLLHRLIPDPAGLATYLLIWPEDGVMRKEDVRKVFYGSMFQEKQTNIRRNKETGNVGDRAKGSQITHAHFRLEDNELYAIIVMGHCIDSKALLDPFMLLLPRKHKLSVDNIQFVNLRGTAQPTFLFLFDAPFCFSC